MRSWISIAAAGLCLILAACAAPRADNDADRMGRTLIDAVQRNDWIVIDKNLGKVMAEDPQHAPKIVVLQGHFPPEPPWSIKLIASTRTPPGRGPQGAPERSTLKYLYTFAQKRLVIDLGVEQDGWRRVYEPQPLKAGQIPPRVIEQPVEMTEPPKPTAGERPYKVAKVFKLTSMAVTPVDPAAERANGFWAPGKSPTQWAFLLATFATPAAMLAAAVAALRAKNLKRKWLWALAGFAGVGAVWMDWTTGQWGAAPAVNLVGFGLSKGPSPLDPWILRFALPAGAAVTALRLWLHGRKART